MRIATSTDPDTFAAGIEMGAVETIRAVLHTQLLGSELTTVPARGASETEIEHEQLLLRRPLCRDHIAVLRHWNGIDLEVVKLFGCGENTGEIARLSMRQIEAITAKKSIVIGCDASGFLYLQTPDGNVISYDSDGGQYKNVAKSLDDFFERLIFGPDAANFAGDEWLNELRDAGMIRE